MIQTEREGKREGERETERAHQCMPTIDSPMKVKIATEYMAEIMLDTVTDKETMESKCQRTFL